MNIPCESYVTPELKIKSPPEITPPSIMRLLWDFIKIRGIPAIVKITSIPGDQIKKAESVDHGQKPLWFAVEPESNSVGIRKAVHFHWEHRLNRTRFPLSLLWVGPLEKLRNGGSKFKGKYFLRNWSWGDFLKVCKNLFRHLAKKLFQAKM